MSMVEINFSLEPWTFQLGKVFVWRVGPTSKQESLLDSFQSSVTITQSALPGTEWRFRAEGVATPFQTYVTTADPTQFADISPSSQFVDLVRSPPGVVVTDAQLRQAMVTSPIEAVVTPGVPITGPLRPPVTPAPVTPGVTVTVTPGGIHPWHPERPIHLRWFHYSIPGWHGYGCSGLNLYGASRVSEFRYERDQSRVRDSTTIGINRQQSTAGGDLCQISRDC